MQLETTDALLTEIGRLHTALAQAERRAIAAQDAAQCLVTAWRRERAALRTIRDSYGHVCDDFDTCDHPACRASYAAWHLADVALRGEGV